MGIAHRMLIDTYHTLTFKKYVLANLGADPKYQGLVLQKTTTIQSLSHDPVKSILLYIMQELEGKHL